MILLNVDLLERIDAGGLITPSEAEDNDNRLALAGFLNIAALVFVIVAFCRWIHRAYGNLSSIHRGSLRFSPGWAVGWFLVPIMNLFRPYQVMNELHKTSNPAGAGSRVVGWWWGLWIVAGVVGSHFGTFFQEQTVTDLILDNKRGIASEAVLAVVAVLALLIVHRITSWQDEHATATS